MIATICARYQSSLIRYMLYRKSIQRRERNMKKGKLFRSAIARVTLVAVVAVTFSSIVTATEVHKWVDENGVVHFSDTKPMSVESQAIEMRDSGYSQSGSSAAQQNTSAEPSGTEPQLSAAQTRREEIARKRKERKEAAAEAEYLCARHSQRLEQMEPARRAYYTDENGQQVRMDDVKRVELVDESKAFISENCQ